MKKIALRPKDFFRSPRDFVAFFLATGLGAGLSPLAPGTLGSLLGLLVAYFAVPLPPSLRILLWLSLTALGVWCSSLVAQKSPNPDHPSIVIDEVAGMWLTGWLLDFTDWQLVIWAFVLFRIFDILKPWPIRTIDSWSKNQVKKYQGAPVGYWWSGLGVMADDVAAALIGLLIYFFTRAVFPL